MKKLLFLMLAVMVGVVASAQSLPDVKIENQEGKVISTKSLADGTPMIISFWSTTCKPCIMELNAINDNLYDWLEEVDMKVVAVSVDDARTVSRARAMTKGQGWDDYVCLYDKNQDFKRAMNVSLTPTPSSLMVRVTSSTHTLATHLVASRSCSRRLSL